MTDSEWKKSDGDICCKCASKNVSYRVKESSCGGYEDVNLRCDDCGKTWWVDGCDS